MSTSNYLRSQFKFVNEIDLQKAIAKVRRERTKLKEQEIWSEFCSKELQKLSIQDIDVRSKNETPSSYSSKKTADDNDYKDHALCTDTNWNKKKCFSHMKNMVDLKFQDELHHTKLDRKLPSHKEMSLSYSNVTSISLPCSDSEHTIQSKLEEIEEKIKFMCSKILNVMEVIESNLNNFREPETSVEILQYHRKASEFCIRFSRNHFYQIESQFNLLMSIDNNMNQYSATKTGKLMQSQKILKLFQTLLLGYYTFYRHMYIVWGYNGIAEKLNNLLNVTQKILNTSKAFQTLKEIPMLNELKTIVRRMMDSIKDSIGCTHSSMCASLPKKMSSDTRRIKSANSSLNKFHSAKSTNSDFVPINKRRVRSASSVDPYYMYQNKQVVKNGFNCKVCCVDEKCDKPNSDVFKRLTTANKSSLNQNILSNKENKKNYHKNCHPRRNFIASKSVNDLKKNYDKENKAREHLQENKDVNIKVVSNKNNQKTTKRLLFTEDSKKNISENDDDSVLVQDKKDEALVKRLIPLIADHFRGMYENAIDEVKTTKKVDNSTVKVQNFASNNKEGKIKSCKSHAVTEHKGKSATQNIQMVIVSHDSDNLKSPNSPSHYFQDSAIKHILDDAERTVDENGGTKEAIGPNKTLSTRDDQSEYRKKPSQISKISEELIASELSLITMEIDKPLKQFIKKELSDFSNFLYKTRSIKH
ncbi:uncharacterized protein LOC143911136 [Arctopsyche grandis]|uniref:uncharacterized protein LOC143911136 n=1 Tax=Arctopsyche grandis TaxID=121162 RepID=UPI00406D87EA